MNAKSFAPIIFMLAAITGASAQEQGKQIFQSQCTACHSVNSQLVGPALAGVEKRRDIDWITHFVRSSQAVIKGGDPYANGLFNKFNKIVMPDHPDLTDAQIKDIVAYIVSESKPVAAEKPPFPKLYDKAPAYLPLSLHNYDFMAIYLASVLVLVLALYLAVRAKELERERKPKQPTGNWRF